MLTWEARRYAKALGDDVSRVFFMCGTLTAVLWVLYPVAWGICEGGNVIAPDSEAIFYSILDFCAKPVFGALLIWGHKDIEPARLGLAIRDYEDDPIVHEKRNGIHNEIGNGTNGTNGTNGHSTGISNGASNGITNGHGATTAPHAAEV